MFKISIGPPDRVPACGALYLLGRKLIYGALLEPRENRTSRCYRRANPRWSHHQHGTLNMGIVVFANARIFDGASADYIENGSVIVEDGIIQAVEPTQTSIPSADVVDCTGRTLMPGMIDAHVHVNASSCNLTLASRNLPSYNTAFAARFLRNSLECGFTTVRDVGGADAGLGRAVREGLIVGARLLYGGRIISQTGGHGDFRPPDEATLQICGCCSHQDGLSVLVDGVSQVRRAVREEIRRGASHVKIMASGGVASPSDPLERCQFSDEEIIAAVDEATRAGVYVAAHCHPTDAVRRCVQLGVKSIEHGTLIDESTAAFAASRGAFIVPTMAVIFALRDEGAELGLSSASLEKLHKIVRPALKGLEIMNRAGVKMGFGTDLLGPHYTRQCTEFLLRREVLSPLEILRSACSINAELLGKAGVLGCIAPGAIADILVIDGDPLRDIAVLSQNGTRISVIMRNGSFHRRAL
jgi:imidazolonepropionase-like amidohydrolase